MWKRLGQAALVLVVVFVAAQFIQPQRANPATDSTRAIQSQLGAASALPAVLDRSCGDCHSNASAWPSYTRIAPLSWVVARAMNEGRKAVNFSEWTDYSPGRRRALLAVSCRDASNGTMPMRAYTALRPAAQLSPQDVETICAASRQAAQGAATDSAPPSRSAR